MRNLNKLQSVVHRRTDREVIKFYGSAGDETCGVFMVASPIDHAPMMIVASAGNLDAEIDGQDAWDHVSVSRKNRPPNWAEMSYVYGLFFENDEVAMQLHVPAVDHINYHPNCLHIWRPRQKDIPLPPPIMVGPSTRVE